MQSYDKEMQGHFERLNHISYMLDLLIDLERSYNPYMSESKKAEILHRAEKEVANIREARAKKSNILK